MTRLSLSLLLIALSGAAQAHTGAGATHGFVAGFSHPLGGLDHLLAMLAAGVFAGQLGGRAVWLVPAAFLGMMAAGGVAGMAGGAWSLAEAGIAVSVLVFGAAVALGRAVPVTLAMALAGGFAAFHGFAHGAEMPGAASGTDYVAGFLAASALLLVAGAGLAIGARRAPLVRIGGGIVAAAGLGLLAGAA